MSGDVDVAHAPCVNVFQKSLRRQQTVIDGVDVDIVHVQMNAAIGLACNRVEELDLVHLGKRGMQVVGRVFHGDATAQPILYFADTPCRMMHHFFSERQRQQIVKMTAVVAVAQMIGEKRAIVTAHHFFDAIYQISIQRGLPAQRHRQSVQRQRQPFRYAVKLFARPAAHFQPVFGGSFNKAYRAVV